MSVVAYTDLRPESIRVKHAAWYDLANGDSGSPFGHPEHSDRSIQVYGVFGAGGTLLIEGRNSDAAPWAVLSDPQGNALSITVADVYQVTEVTEQIRVRVSAGDGTTDLTAVIAARGNIW